MAAGDSIRGRTFYASFVVIRDSREYKRQQNALPAQDILIRTVKLRGVLAFPHTILGAECGPRILFPFMDMYMDLVSVERGLGRA